MNVRDSFFYELYAQVKAGSDAVIVSSDLGAPSLDDFRRDYPQRFVNVGIAEQNAIAVASGLALAGKIAFTYGLNPFPVTRSFDHIRNLLASLQIPVTVAALKAGSCTAEAGFSHMAVENMSLLRTLRNVRIVNPSDETVSRRMVREVVKNPKPGFVQFDPFIGGVLYDETEIDFSKGFAVSGKEHDIAVATYGIWAHRLKKEALPVKLIDCFSLPVEEALFVEELRNCRKIITIEDGVAAGGIGSMVLEIMSDFGLSVPLKRMALRFHDGYPVVSSDRERIFDSEGLTLEALKKEI